jgi:hypothetical protein
LYEETVHWQKYLSQKAFFPEMNSSSEGGNVNDLANTEQNDNSTRSIKEFFQRFFKSYLLIPPSENTNLVCVNTVYILFVFWILLTTSLLYAPPFRDRIEQELKTCRDNPGGTWKVDCESYHSVETITNRIGFTLATSFVILALLCTRAETIHEGFWLGKFLLIFILLLTCFMIPTGRFDFVWTIVSFVGSLLFRFVEIVLILDFATTASDVFVFKITEERSRAWYLMWLLLNWTIYVTTLGAAMFFFVFYKDGCGLNFVLVTVVLILSALSTLLVVYFSEKRTGFLHSGLCTLYMLLLTLVALHHEGSCHNDISTTKLRHGREHSEDIGNRFEIVLGFLLVTYAVLRKYSQKYYHISGSTISRHFVARRNEESIEAESLSSEDEMNNRVFNASAFFTILAVFSLFATSKLTSLRTAKSSEPIVGESATFHSRSLTILLILISIIWSQLFPVVYPNEDPFDLSVLGKTFLKYQLKLCWRLLIDGCGCCNGPTASRYIFTGLFVLGVLFSCLLYIPEIRHSISESTYFCSTLSTSGVCLSTDPVYMAVYRVCIAMATFYLLFAVILVCVDDTRDPRVDLQYKAWPVKFCLFFSLLLAGFLLPNKLSRMWIYTALIGTCPFTILQLVLLIYWAKTTAISFKEKVKNSNSKIWSILLIGLTIFMIVLSLAAIVIFYVFFSKFSSRCLTNTIFITLNLILIVTASLVSVHPMIYDAGLFQCYVIVIFSLHLTWSGLLHNPDEKCNPMAGYIVEVYMHPNFNIQAGLEILFTIVTVLYYSREAPNISQSCRNVYEIFRRMYYSSRKQNPSTVSLVETGSQTEAHSPLYNFPFFHAVYFLASLHATVILTNWFIPTNASRFKLSINWTAMHFKMTTSNIPLFVYIWIMAKQLFTG